jgi:hypothetical protein
LPVIDPAPVSLVLVILVSLTPALDHILGLRKEVIEEIDWSTESTSAAAWAPSRNAPGRCCVR